MKVGMLDRDAAVLVRMPGAANGIPLLDHDEVGDALALQFDAGADAAEACADDHHLIIRGDVPSRGDCFVG